MNIGALPSFLAVGKGTAFYVGRWPLYEITNDGIVFIPPLAPSPAVSGAAWALIGRFLAWGCFGPVGPSFSKTVDLIPDVLVVDMPQ